MEEAPAVAGADSYAVSRGFAPMDQRFELTLRAVLTVVAARCSFIMIFKFTWLRLQEPVDARPVMARDNLLSRSASCGGGVGGRGCGEGSCWDCRRESFEPLERMNVHMKPSDIVLASVPPASRTVPTAVGAAGALDDDTLGSVDEQDIRMSRLAST